jgi:hypothetical protein
MAGAACLVLKKLYAKYIEKLYINTIYLKKED